MAQIKVVFLMHDVDNFNGSDGPASDFMYATAENGTFEEGTAIYGKTKTELCANLGPGSDNAKAAFDTKVHADADAAKTAMGVNNMDLSDASGTAWALSADGKELSLTVDFADNTDAVNFQKHLVERDPWATAGLVWQDHSKSVWTKDH